MFQQEHITTKNLHRLNAWCSRGDSVYLTIYVDAAIAYESPIAADGELDEEKFDIAFESKEREYTLNLADGISAQAFLYYYSGDAFYDWVAGISGILFFITFSLCLIAFVHRKLRYVKQLKADLDILAGGDLTYSVRIWGKDELGELACGIEQMRCSILCHQKKEAQMRSANSQLVTAMSHDLRTPLTSLLAYLELMDRGKYQNEEQLHHFIRRSLERALHIKSLADKLFEYFLVYSSEWEQPDMEITDADALFQQFWGEYAFSLESQGLTVQCKMVPLDGSLSANIGLLRRAFDNLYSNLIKYADTCQPIEIVCCRKEDTVRLTLVNGISPHRDKKESTHIGLNTCQRVMQYHAGSFSITEANGKFEVNLTFPLLRNTR